LRCSTAALGLWSKHDVAAVNIATLPVPPRSPLVLNIPLHLSSPCLSNLVNIGCDFRGVGSHQKWASGSFSPSVRIPFDDTTAKHVGPLLHKKRLLLQDVFPVPRRVDEQFETSPLVNESAKPSFLCESNLTELKHTLDSVNRRVDFLLDQSLRTMRQNSTMPSFPETLPLWMDQGLSSPSTSSHPTSLIPTGPRPIMVRDLVVSLGTTCSVAV